MPPSDRPARSKLLLPWLVAVAFFMSGWMADRFGTRRVFASAIGVFGYRGVPVEQP